jgi:hypothetical protein
MPMTAYPIPDIALDDRLFFGGTTGSGKTYNAMGRVERLLKRHARVVIPDPLGVWWGLRLDADGKIASGYDAVIFGGPHGDLPLTEYAAPLIGETVAGMKESCIIDLSELGTKAAERRFMLAFLTALYKHTTGEPLHVIFDEADMWSPQKLLDKEGDAAKLLGMMETIVRRGRVKGFIPWLISQRPAVISKDVLSQVDGIVAFKLTSSQDRDAIGDWVQGQADKKQWQEIWAQLPTMERGQGVVWIPGRGILHTVQFPPKETFDSSRAPKRGERVKRAAALKPLDLGKLKERLAVVEKEAKANDPKLLRTEITKLQAEKATLEKQVASAVAAKRPPDKDALKRIEQRAIEQAKRQYVPLRAALEAAMKFIIEINARDFFKAGGDAVDKKAVEKAIGDATQHITRLIEKHLEGRERQFNALRGEAQRLTARLKSLIEKADEDVKIQVAVRHNEPFTISAAPPPILRTKPPLRPAGDSEGQLPGNEQRVLNALATWRGMGHASPTNPQVAWLANYSPTSSSYTNPRGALRSKGLIEYLSEDRLALTEAGAALAIASPIDGSLLDHVLARLPGNERRVLSAVAARFPEVVSNEEAAAGAAYSPTSSSYTNPRGALRSKSLIIYEGNGLRAVDWLFPELAA